MWKFVKELVILFHRIPAAPWSHVVSTIKEGHLKNLPLFFPLLPLLATGPNCNSPSTANVFGIFPTTQEPRATNAELKGTRITGILSAKPYLTIPFLKPPLTLLPNLTLQNLTLPYLFTYAFYSYILTTY